MSEPTQQDPDPRDGTGPTQAADPPPAYGSPEPVPPYGVPPGAPVGRTGPLDAAATQEMPEAALSMPPVEEAPATVTGPVVGPSPALEADSDPAAPDVTCPRCGEQSPAAANFCQDCGASLTAPVEPATAGSEPHDRAGTVCAACHAGTIDADGYCQACGAAAPTMRDHFVIVAGPAVAGVCDRGIKHGRNEDAMALDLYGEVAAVVVCDGVSTSPESDEASMAAARAALDIMATGALDLSETTGRQQHWRTVLSKSAHAAHSAVSAMSSDAQNAPSCTFVAAVVDEPVVVVASVGDSRGYWLPDVGEPSQMTVDGSWAQEMAEQGMAPADIQKAPHRNAITRWLGADAPPLEPRLSTCDVVEPGWVLLCSDGLWGYAPGAEQMRDLLRAEREELGPDADAERLAGRLVQWANGRGGRDNITAALVRVGQPAQTSGPARSGYNPAAATH